MKTVSAAEMRELDRRTIEESGIPGEELMRRAGRGVAAIAMEMLMARGGKSILMLAGTGNNGGDVFAAAAELAESDIHIEVWICGAQSKISGDAQTHLGKMIRAGILPKEISTASDLIPVAAPDLMIDGLLGTGATGAPRGFMASLIEWINAAAQFAAVLSIDLPSGVDSDSGDVSGAAVKADLTATLALPKTGFIQPSAAPYAGHIKVIDIGIPAALVDQIEGNQEAELIDRTDLFIPRRERDSYKNQYGHVLLFGGENGAAGAIAMSARAALRSGAGLVTVITAPEIAPLVSILAGAEIMVHGFSRRRKIDFSDFDAVLAGPGMAPEKSTKQFVESLLNTLHVPLILDAGALCVAPEKIFGAICPVILTPHPGEFRRMFGAPDTGRLKQARTAAEKTGAVVVLKGAGTVVAAPGKISGVNMTGNPGMATAGAGDVLAGMITALAGKGMDPFDAAKTAVFLHGTAGEFAALDYGQESMTAENIIDALPDAFRSLQIR
ncbi:MAG: NAD(P)H-hydrate dehydratase [Kiritimatiellales bacterium]